MMDTDAPALVPHSGRWRHLLGISLWWLLAALAFNGTLVNLADGLWGRHMERVNRAYLAASEHDAALLLDALGISKTALAVLSSSRGGISFFIDVQVQLGESLSVVRDLVDNAWTVALAAIAATHGLSLVLDLAHMAAAPVLTLVFCGLGLSVGLHSRLPAASRALSETARLLLLLACTVHIAIPLTVYGLAAARHHFLQDHHRAVYEHFTTLQTQWPRHDADQGLHQQTEGSIRHFKDTQDTLRQSAPALAGLAARHMALVGAEYLAAPLILFFGLLAALRAVFFRLWHPAA